MSATLPEGWTGNARCHHRTVGPYRITVYFAGRGIAGRSYTYRIEHIRRSDFIFREPIEPHKIDEWEAAQARDAAVAYLRKLATEVLAALA